MASGKVTDLMDLASFTRVTEHESRQMLVVIDFKAEWCGPCKTIAPNFEALAKQFARDAHFYRVDVDQNREAAQAAQVRAMPTFAFYGNGALIEKIEGANPKKLEQAVQTYAAKYSKNPFKTEGHSLKENKNSSSATQTNSSGRSGGRYNPWRDPNFMPKPKSETAASTANVGNMTKAHEDAVSNGPKSDSTGTSQPSSTPLIQADPVMLAQLKEFGFGDVRSERALIATNNKNIEDAVNWLTDHENDVDIDKPITAASTTTNDNATMSTQNTSHTSNSTDASQTASNVNTDGGNSSAAIDENDLDDDASIILAEFRRKQSKATAHAPKPLANSEKGAIEEKEKKRFGEMSPEEQQKWLANKRMEAKLKREKEERQKEIESEKNRQIMHHGSQELREQIEKQRTEAMIAAKKKAEIERVRVMNEQRKKLAEDKARRQAEYEKAMAEVARMKAAKEAAAAGKK